MTNAVLIYLTVTRGRLATVLKTILTILFAIDAVVLIIIVLMQQGRGRGLGTLAGNIATDTYWGKNKGRSKEGRLKVITRILAIVFVGLALVLNINF